MIRGHPSPYGFDLVGSAFGTVALDGIITGLQCRPGDALIGLPASGVHSNGLTLARRALLTEGELGLDSRPPQLGGASVADALLEPTVIYVRGVLALLSDGPPAHGLAHITGGGLLNLLRLGHAVGFEITRPLAVPPVFELIAELGDVPTHEMWEVFNMGCGFCVVVAEPDADHALSFLAEHHPGAAVIGAVTDRPGSVEVPELRIAGDEDGLRTV